jgi:serine/threonine protein kinase
LPDIFPSRIGPYEVLSRIGAGGMGDVYRARDTRLERIVALKRLPPDRVGDPARTQRIIQEARSVSALNNPHIVQLFDIVEDQGTYVLVLEYAPGRTLDQVVPEGGLPLTSVVDYAIQIADGLAAAHAAGVVHRDLKPGNIMVGPDGSIKLLDFGLAKIVGQPAASTGTTLLQATPATVEGTIVGTVAYMSPEQIEGRTIDGRSDIFSFGAVLYEMMTGRRAFDSGSTMSTLAAILRDEPPPIVMKPGPAADQLVALAGRCLTKARERRWQSAGDLRIALEELREASASYGPIRRHGGDRKWATGISGAYLTIPRKLYIRARDANTLENVSKMGGKVTIRSRIVVSADGKTRTNTQTGMDAKGQKVSSVLVFERQ